MKPLHELLLIGLIAQTAAEGLNALHPKGMRRERKHQFWNLGIFVKRIGAKTTTERQLRVLKMLAREATNSILEETKADYARYQASDDCPEHLKKVSVKEVQGTAFIQTLVACLYQMESMIVLTNENDEHIKLAIGTKDYGHLQLLIRVMLDGMLALFAPHEINTLNEASARLGVLVKELLISEKDQIYAPQVQSAGK